MTTYTLNFTDLIGNFWTMDWKPSTSKNKNLAEADIHAVINFIKTGKWAKAPTAAAKNCYDMLAVQIANYIVEEATNSRDRAVSLYSKIVYGWSDQKFSKKGNMIFNQIEQCIKEPKSTENTMQIKKLLKKIIKTENLFAIKLADAENWLVDVSAEFKCCICGAIIADNDHSHDPYPVRPESWYGERENRCCDECNSHIILPIRAKHGRHAPEHREQLMKMSYEELLDFAPAIRFPSQEEILKFWNEYNKQASA